MKKTISLLLALLCMINNSLAIANGESIRAELRLDENSTITSSAVLDEQLILIMDGLPFSCIPGNSELHQLALTNAGEANTKPQNWQLFTSGNSLYALDMVSKAAIYPITIKEGAFILEEEKSIDETALWDENHQIMQPDQVFGFGNRLFLYFHVMQGETFAPRLVSYDIASGGAATIHNAQNIWALCPYTNNRLLALVIDYRQRFDRNTNTLNNFMLATYDIVADSISPYADSGVPFNALYPALYFEPSAGIIYIKSKQNIYRHQSPHSAVREASLAEYQSFDATPQALYFVPGDNMIIVSRQSITVQRLNKVSAPNHEINILGGYEMDMIHRKTVSDMGETPVAFLSQRLYGSALELAQALVSGGEDMDLIILRSNYIDISQLTAKGYASPLDDSPALKAFVDTLYPDIKEVALRNEHLFMVPVGIDPQGVPCFNAEALSRMGDFALPQTYDELIDLLMRWDSDYKDLYPDILPFAQSNIRELMFRLAISLYKNTVAAQGKAFSFEDPALTSMLERALTLPKTHGDGIPFDPADGRALLFSDYAAFDLNSISACGRAKAPWAGDQAAPAAAEACWMPLPLRLPDGQTSGIPATITLMMVNARSKNKEEATRYIEKYVENMRRMTPAMYMMMSPTVSAPLDDPAYPKERAAIDEQIAFLRRSLETAEGAEKTQLEARLSDAMQQSSMYDDLMRYSVSKEAVSQYRQLMANSYVDLSVYYRGLLGPDMDALIGRVLDGQLSLKGFIELAENRLRLMRGEDGR